MRSAEEILALLDELDHIPADELEDQDLDFKQWNSRSIADSIKLVIEMAVCMANGGGGTVVFGVNDRAIGRSSAILGVPMDVDINRLKKSVYDSSDPRLTPVFEELWAPEGTGRLLVMQVYPGMPPYTDSSGAAKIRVGRDCQPLTGTMRLRLHSEAGNVDFTASLLSGTCESLISPGTVEQLKKSALKERAPSELLRGNDREFLTQLGLTESGQLSRAGLLLSGTSSALEKELPGYLWTYLHMKADTDYDDRLDGRDAIPIAIEHVIERIMAQNPITTIIHGLYHFEYRTYPEIALREALMNAFCHNDYRCPGPVMVKHYADKLEISNLGGFIGGISPENILHHPPATRNPKLVEALVRLRLVNRSSLGVQRMFRALLEEGKEPPLIEEAGAAVRVTFLARPILAPFKAFIEDENRKGRILSVDELLIISHLLHHSEITSSEAARLCQRKEYEARTILSAMEGASAYIERGGTGRETYWTLRPLVHRSIASSGQIQRNGRIEWEAAKTRILSMLTRNDAGLSNAEIRQITRYDRNQAYRLMRELMTEDSQLHMSGKGRHVRYHYAREHK